MRRNLILTIVFMVFLTSVVIASSPSNTQNSSNWETLLAKQSDNLSLWTMQNTKSELYSTSACSIGKWKDQQVISLGNCDCSKCRANQYCCPTANGYCGCFPMPCPK